MPDHYGVVIGTSCAQAYWLEQARPASLAKLGNAFKKEADPARAKSISVTSIRPRFRKHTPERPPPLFPRQVDAKSTITCVLYVTICARRIDVNAEASIHAAQKHRWQRKLSVVFRRSRVMPLIEFATVLALIVMASISYFIIVEQGTPQSLLTPPLVAALLVANLVPAMALMVLVARRVAMRRAAASPIGGRGRLHVRLVALFSVIASVPTLLVVIFASVLFQSGMKFWFSERAGTVLENATNASQIYQDEHRRRIRADVEAMGADMVDRINRYGITSEALENDLIAQTTVRQIDETAILTLNSRGEIQRQIEWNPDKRPLAEQFSRQMLIKMRAGEAGVAQTTRDRVEAIVRLDPQVAIYFYGSRRVSAAAITALAKARDAASEYRQTLERSRTLQFRFNALLLLISLLIVGVAIWIALALADRLVRPVGELVDAARRVTDGDLSARVPNSRIKDEVGTWAAHSIV
jgi:two-component system nitrogen regulation sensor histidine kinase NtrY